MHRVGWATVVAALFACGETLPVAVDDAAGADAGPDAPASSDASAEDAAAPIVSTVGVLHPSTRTFELRFANAAGAADRTIAIPPAQMPVAPFAGHWKGTERDWVGYHVPNLSTPEFHLLGPDQSDLVVGFGAQSTEALPVVGDWNGDGVSTIGFYLPTTSAFFLSDTNAAGGATYQFGFGVAGSGAFPVAGDWDGNGKDGIGLFLPSTGTFVLKNAPTAGDADVAFAVVAEGKWLPIAGDWDGDGKTNVGLFQSATGTFRLLDSGGAEQRFAFGAGDDALPVAGKWAR